MSVWAAGITAVGSIAGGYLSGQGAKTGTYIPRRATKDAERDRIAALSNNLYGSARRSPSGGLAGSAEDLYTNPDNFPQFGPMPFSAPNQYELGGIEQLGGFATQAFPEMYNTYANSVMDGVSNGGLDAYTNSFQDLLPRLQQMFGNGAPQVQGGNVNFNPGVEGMYRQFMPSEAGAWTPQSERTVTANANPTLERLLSGNADVQGLNGAVDSYLAPIMEKFNEQILPSLQRADAASTGGQSSAGALKGSQRVLEQVGEDTQRYTQGLLYDASQQGLDRATQAAGLVTQGRQADTGLQQQAAGIGQQGLFGSGGLGIDQFRANLSLDQMMAGLEEGNANRGVAVGTTNAGLQQSRLDQLLAGAGMGADSANQGTRNRQGFASLMPAALQAGMIGPQALSLAGTGLRGLLDPYAQYNSDLFTYNQNLPYQMSNQWTGILQGLSPQTTAAAQPQQSQGGNVGAGLATMLSMWPKAGASGQGTQASMGSPGATTTFDPRLAGIGS